MQVLKLEQGSEEWLEYRKGKSGGSEFKDLYVPGLPLKTAIIKQLEKFQPLPPADKRLTAQELAGMLEPEELVELKTEGKPKKRFYEIIAERVAKPLTPNDYADRLGSEPFSMVARGHILESEAIEAFEAKTGKKVDPDSVVWVSDYDENCYISPDGCITSKDGKVREAVEVKCLGSPEIVKAYITKAYPEEYRPQVLKYFMVNEDLEVLHFVLYTDLIPGLELQIFEIKREQVAGEIEEAKAFEVAMMRKVAKYVDEIEKLGF